MVRAIEEWQRGVIAVGLLGTDLQSSQLEATGFIVDLESGLIVTCAHVVLSAFSNHKKNPTLTLDPGDELAIGVGGEGERIDWRCRAKPSFLSRPPADYPGPPPPVHWTCIRDDGTRLDLAILRLVDATPAVDASTALARAGRHAKALSLGLPPTHPLSPGDPLVMLGYGQNAQTGAGVERTATTTRGYFAGEYSSDAERHWLKVDARILSGHSGGPVVNRGGEVVGWACKARAPLAANPASPLPLLSARASWRLSPSHSRSVCFGRSPS